ncbi:MAG: glycosyltransferase family 2 protein, partial [Sulfurimonadaceae bacterium]|nr:glycosyltransferase family 2 protein [Sulfurimonadaceae bacterium]
MITNISCVLIAKNAEATLREVLESLDSFQDVVVYSNNSTDKTDAIAQSFSNVTLINGDFLGFGPTKNKAASYAKNDWILSLDADEVLSQELVIELSHLKLKENFVYSLLRKNYYKKQQIKYCWGNDILTRLYNKQITSFTDAKVHEYIIKNSLESLQLTGDIKHYPYSTVSDFIIKLDRYSTIFAEEHVGKK